MTQSTLDTNSTETLITQGPIWNWIAQLADENWAVAYDVVPKDLSRALLEQVRGFHKEDILLRAGIGRASDLTVDTSVRRDKIRWLGHQDSVQSQYLNIMEGVRQEVNRALFMGLFAYEAHYAVYEKGGFYARHFDAFKGAKNRVLSTVFYLNPDWVEADGGELNIYADTDDVKPLATIPPEAGSLVLFLSEDVPHEVLEARNDRYSIAGWFRVNDRLGAPVLQVVEDGL
ncbi:2OG-Fe(II) oxygenase [Hirschia litorea]|uniref:2OG-Fe(II) oxygenase n=1 Tax=Hirschia litorea TaxID=1199156 RepID=A0ABW2IL47_9PROT